jgi:hypothetical protein
MVRHRNATNERPRWMGLKVPGDTMVCTRKPLGQSAQERPIQRIQRPLATLPSVL